MKRSILAAAAVVLIGSCGSGGSGSGPTATARNFPTLDSLISSIGDVGCELAEVEPVEGYDIDEQAECPDASVRVYTFNSTISERQVIDAIREIEDRFAVEGDLWAAETSSRSLAEKIRTAIGGTIRS
jgi:hypothetical protein